EACVKRAGVLIVALDDIHWMDQASLALLEHLLPLASRLPLLLLLLYRTDPARSHWRIHEKALRELAPWTSAVALRQLTADESDQLLVNLVRLDRWPAGFRERLIQRADGNPLYIEELIRVLIDDQVLRQDARNVWQVSGDLTAMQVPKTLEGVLMAR